MNVTVFMILLLVGGNGSMDDILVSRGSFALDVTGFCAERAGFKGVNMTDLTPSDYE